jgi:hypothetical protein
VKAGISRIRPADSDEIARSCVNILAFPAFLQAKREAQTATTSRAVSRRANNFTRCAEWPQGGLHGDRAPILTLCESDKRKQELSGAGVPES